MRKLVAYLCFLLGFTLILLSSALIYQRYNPNRLSFSSYAQGSVMHTGSNPLALVIPSINKSLAVYPSHIHGSTWETTTQGVSYLTSSPLPGDPGNSIIYGHNWSSIFGDLKRVKPGDQISVIFQNGKKKKFNVEFITTVNSNQTQILNPSKESRLTIYTCTGLLDTKRLVITASLINS